MPDLSRRSFLGLAGGAAGAAVGGTLLWRQLVDDHVHDRRSGTPTRRDRILVVMELGGGNDGLNTLVPADGHYRDARPTLAVPEADLLALDGEDAYSFHPSLAPVLPHWEAGHLAAIQSIGFGGQTRSHFAATDVWHAGGVFPFSTSWLGRWLDATGAEDASPLRAIALGNNTRVLAAEQSLSTVVGAPETFRLLAPEGPATDPDAVVAAFTATAAPVSDDPLVASAQIAIPAALEGVDVLAQATASSGGERTTTTDARATDLLRTVTQIIGLDVGTQVFVVGVGEFDTHAGQPDRHPVLLADVFGGVAQFLATMEEQGRADDVLVITTSEFGRRVAENGSAGTDHGNGSVQFLLGNAVQGEIVGRPDLVHLDEGDVPVEIETRSLYANALDWLGGPTDEILNGSFDRFGLVDV
jgi:uncharacterized protein (DUF1501 family)